MIRLLIAAFIFLTPWVASGHEAGKGGLQGVLEHWSYEGADKRLVLSGWVLAGQDGRTPPDLALSVLDSTFPLRGVKWTERADASALGAGRLGLGYLGSVELPGEVPAGPHQMQLDAIFSDGMRVALPSASADPPVLVVEQVRARHWWIFGIVVLVALVICFGKIGRWKTTQRLRRWVDGSGVYWLVATSFTILVGFGITGSSVGLLAKSPYGKNLLDAGGSDKKLFGLRSIRADEWSVLIPNVLAQIHHEPRFPIVNSNIGEDGQNMGVIGMTGVPVWQLAAIARPATWGYFFLPLRQALSWQWQLPFWGGLLALWCLLNVLRPGNRGLNLGLSFAFCVAPYAAAWSNWPLYAMLFPAFAFVLFSQLLRTSRLWRAVALSMALGWALACWVLVLYPPWIIVTASVFLFLGVGWCIDNRAELRWGLPQTLGVAIAGLIILALLGSWWLDTRDAVALMRVTEYPGKRGSMPGGDLAWWWHLRGYNNAEVVLRTPGPSTNQSEASSYFLLPLLLVALCARHLMESVQRRWAVVACAAFVVCYWIYCFAGVPVWLAKYSLWGNIPTVRMDVGVGLATIVLMALVLDTGSRSERPQRLSSIVAWSLPGLVTAGSAALIAAALAYTPKSFMPGGSPVYTAAMVVTGAGISWWMMKGRTAAAVGMLATVHLLTSLAFNPFSKAPSSMELASGNRTYVFDTKEPRQAMRVLALNGDGIGALMLAAVGIPIANGVFYYPHRAFWERMGLDEAEWATVNRYQHLGFYVEPAVVKPEGYDVSSPALDHVRVQIHPQRFDFSRTGADRVAVRSEFAQALHANASLTWLGQFRDMHWFAVRSNAGTSAER